MKIKNLFFCLLVSQIIWAQNKPKLVVGIVVDQMKPEYLYRFQDDFSNNGFKRLMNDGFVFKNTHYNYVPTYTAPGHASIYTGTTPANHGIVGNYWFHKSENQVVYCTTDTTCNVVGDDNTPKAGQNSPHRLETTTITDELKLATNFKSKVIGISIKDRGAILPAGHFADIALWMNDNGNFVSSSFYTDKLPNWAEQYNKKEYAKKYIKKGWKLLKSKETYNESLADNNPYERIFKPKNTPTFPYDLKKMSEENGIQIIKSTPYGNTMVAELAKESIKAENLGKNTQTDFLAISFSSTDYVGHSFGPMSRELQDTYLRLDLTIADLLETLDKEVGKGNYLLFLTSDHAAAENPILLKDKGYAVDNLGQSIFKEELQEFLNNRYQDNLLLDYHNQNIFLNEDLIKSKKLNYNQILDEIIDFSMKKSFIKRVFKRADILHGDSQNDHLKKIKKGYDPKQNGDLVILLKPGFMEYYETGTTHGSGYSYDTHVPNIWFGWGIKKGQSVDKKLITQIAPTISMLLNINFPNASNHNVLLEIFEN